MVTIQDYEKGTGVICAFCQDTKVCEDCTGTGTVPCTCTKGKCYYCDGAGKVKRECANCQGTGICESCGGSGIKSSGYECPCDRGKCSVCH